MNTIWYAPAEIEYAAWRVALNICTAAALRRGILLMKPKPADWRCRPANLQPGFTLSGLGRAGGGTSPGRSGGAVLMKRIAFVFSTVQPHGSASGREGLDALLATSALTEALGVFYQRRRFSWLPDKNQTLCWREWLLLSLFDFVRY